MWRHQKAYRPQQLRGRRTRAQSEATDHVARRWPEFDNRPSLPPIHILPRPPLPLPRLCTGAGGQRGDPGGWSSAGILQTLTAAAKPRISAGASLRHPSLNTTPRGLTGRATPLQPPHAPVLTLTAAASRATTLNQRHLSPGFPPPPIAHTTITPHRAPPGAAPYYPIRRAGASRRPAASRRRVAPRPPMAASGVGRISRWPRAPKIRRGGPTKPPSTTEPRTRSGT